MQTVRPQARPPNPSQLNARHVATVLSPWSTEATRMSEQFMDRRSRLQPVKRNTAEYQAASREAIVDLTRRMEHAWNTADGNAYAALVHGRLRLRRVRRHAFARPRRERPPSPTVVRLGAQEHAARVRGRTDRALRCGRCRGHAHDGLGAVCVAEPRDAETALEPDARRRAPARGLAVRRVSQHALPADAAADRLAAEAHPRSAANARVVVAQAPPPLVVEPPAAGAAARAARCLYSFSSSPEPVRARRHARCARCRAINNASGARGRGEWTCLRRSAAPHSGP